MNKVVEGKEELLRKLIKLGKIDIEKALNRAGIIIENQAKINETAIDTGELRRSITHQANQNEVVIGTNISYAPYIEFGTGLFASNGDGRKDRWCYKDEKGEWHSTIGQRPKPFLGPALHQKKQKAIKEMMDEIERQMRKIAND